MIIDVYGEPVGKARPRMTMSGHVYTPKKTVDYEKQVSDAYKAKYGCELAFDADVALEATITAYYKIPKSATKKRREMMLSGEVRPTKKPDADNIIKVMLDALNGLAYKDDAQVTTCHLAKYYADEPRVRIIIEGIENDGY